MNTCHGVPSFTRRLIHKPCWEESETLGTPPSASIRSMSGPFDTGLAMRVGLKESLLTCPEVKTQLLVTLFWIGGFDCPSSFHQEVGVPIAGSPTGTKLSILSLDCQQSNEEAYQAPKSLGPVVRGKGGKRRKEDILFAFFKGPPSPPS